MEQSIDVLLLACRAWAIFKMIVIVAPNTVKYRPKSKTIAVANSTLPKIERCNSAQVCVKKGTLKNKQPKPVAMAINKPTGINVRKRNGKMLSITSDPYAIYIKMTAADVTNPPTKPPPGELCPASNK